MRRNNKIDRDRRMKWWREARFGMFIHWGLYSQLERDGAVMFQEKIPVHEYESLAQTWKVKDRPAREWARLAKRAGMKYMVLTTKHHEGFCLWDTEQTDYNAVKCTPGRDLVREYVEACREFGLKVGVYYSLLDWHHPDGKKCAMSEAARRRFVDFTHGCVRELCSNYGKIDILWYDVAFPLPKPEQWESGKMNAMVRRLQPEIIINNRSLLNEDFGTPEERINAEEEGRDWEACMPFNRSWGYVPCEIDWHSPREVIMMLCTVTGHGGNLLLNVGPLPDGSVTVEATERLTTVGKWTKRYGDAMYGNVDRIDLRFDYQCTGFFTMKGSTAYFWCKRWPGGTLTLGGQFPKVLNVKYVHNGRDIDFVQERERLILKGLPKTSPDKIAGVTVIQIELASKPRKKFRAIW
jgi:alpha-L-fucosidase